ncbi:MAG: hypothetical protein AB1Z98_01345 [Nannocystaceae bacterium]
MPTLAVALAAGGCTRVSDQSRFEGPQEELEILVSTPEHEQVEVDADVRVDLCMSGRLDPRSLEEVDATLSSGGSIADAELSVQLVPWLEPGIKAPPRDTTAPWCGGSVLSIAPQAPLSPGVQYRLRLRPTAVGWSGESPLTEGPQWTVPDDGAEPRYVLEFTVDPAAPGQPPVAGDEPEPPPTLTDLFASGGPFDPARELCSCHRDPRDLAFELLDLREPAAAYETLVGSSRLRDTGFPMVAPRDPSGSFLVHKLLRRSDEDDRALEGVLGDPMPLGGDIEYRDLLRIVQWIEGGANP